VEGALSDHVIHGEAAGRTDVLTGGAADAVQGAPHPGDAGVHVEIEHVGRADLLAE
jgi:hypothetical protein